VVGMMAIFWKAPLLLQQIYLVLISSLMAFSLSTLAEWTTWGLLGVLVVWDLFAVLAPFGPLRLLIEASQNQNQEVPGLLYSVGTLVWFMAYEDPLRTPDRENGRENEPGRFSTTTAGDQDRPTTTHRGAHPDSFYPPVETRVADEAARPLQSTTSSIRPHASQNNPTASMLHSTGPTHHDATPASANRPSAQPAPQLADDEEEERQGLKLGLGDFVFYSVLVARAALTDWLTTAACAVAVVQGLTSTIFLLAILRKALPALPVSIVLGMVFYFVTSYALFPYVRSVNVTGVVL